MQPRQVVMKCGYCNGAETSIMVSYGHFISLKEGVYCEILMERPGCQDTFVCPVVCANCGCQSGLTFKK